MAETAHCPTATERPVSSWHPFTSLHPGAAQCRSRSLHRRLINSIGRLSVRPNSDKTIWTDSPARRLQKIGGANFGGGYCGNAGRCFRPTQTPPPSALADPKRAPPRTSRRSSARRGIPGAPIGHERRRWTARSIARRNPGVTPSENKNGLPEGKPLIYLVAGARFELATFGL